jgi:hypothetical protein
LAWECDVFFTCLLDFKLGTGIGSEEGVEIKGNRAGFYLGLGILAWDVDYIDTKDS